MLKATHLTEEQWFALCLLVYRLLQVTDLAGARAALEGAGFRADTTDPEDPDVHLAS